MYVCVWGRVSLLLVRNEIKRIELIEQRYEIIFLWEL